MDYKIKYLKYKKKYLNLKKNIGGNQETNQVSIEKKQLILNDFIADILSDPFLHNKLDKEILKNANLDTSFLDILPFGDDWQCTNIIPIFKHLCKSIRKNIDEKIFGHIFHKNFEIEYYIMSNESISKILDRLILLKYNILNDWKKFLISYINSNCKSESKCKSDIEIIKNIELNTELEGLTETLPFLFNEPNLPKEPIFYLFDSVFKFTNGIVSKFNSKERNLINFVMEGYKIYDFIDILLGEDVFNVDTKKYPC